MPFGLVMCCCVHMWNVELSLKYEQCVSVIWTSLTNLVMWLGFTFKPIFASDQLASKNTACLKSGPKRLENEHLVLFSLNPWHTLFQMKTYCEFREYDGLNWRNHRTILISKSEVSFDLVFSLIFLWFSCNRKSSGIDLLNDHFKVQTQIPLSETKTDELKPSCHLQFISAISAMHWVIQVIKLISRTNPKHCQSWVNGHLQIATTCLPLFLGPNGGRCTQIWLYMCFKNTHYALCLNSQCKRAYHPQKRFFNELQKVI